MNRNFDSCVVTAEETCSVLIVSVGLCDITILLLRDAQFGIVQLVCTVARDLLSLRLADECTTMLLQFVKIPISQNLVCIL